jgi:predicted transcriptional regulator
MEDRTAKKWTNEENEILLESLGDCTITTITKRLGRTKGSIIHRLERLGLYDMALETGSFRTHEFAEIIGVDPTTVWRWIKEEDMPAKQLYKEGKKHNEGKYFYIFAHEFWRWAKKNKQLIPFKKIQRDVLIPEPDWLDEAIKEDKKAVRHQAYWTSEEDKLIHKFFYQEGMTQEEIGKKIGRSRRGVQRRLATLRLPNKQKIAN